MDLGEQALLAVLVAFIAGVALGLIWARFRRVRSGEVRRAGTSSIHYILGIDLLASRQIDRAIGELTIAARKDTDAIEVFLILGNLLREKGQLERAIQIHQSVLHRPGLSPSERAHTLLCLGMDFKRAGFRNRAVDTLREVVALEPTNPYALSTLLKIHEEDHDWERALESHERLSEVTGRPDAAHLAFLHDELGKKAANESDPVRAIRSFENAIRADGAVAPPHLHYGDLLEAEGRLEEAVACWADFASEHPRQAHLLFERLERVRERLGERSKMAALYASVIVADERDWRARVRLARLRAESGDRDESFRLLFEAVRVNPHALAVHIALWRVLVDAGPNRETIERYLEEVSRSAYFTDPYICTTCSYRANGVLWRCPHCQDWNTFVEERMESVET